MMNIRETRYYNSYFYSDLILLNIFIPSHIQTHNVWVCCSVKISCWIYLAREAKGQVELNL